MQGIYSVAILAEQKFQGKRKAAKKKIVRVNTSVQFSWSQHLQYQVYAWTLRF